MMKKIDEDMASRFVKKPLGFLDIERPDRCSFDHAALSIAFSEHRENATEGLIDVLDDALDAIYEHASGLEWLIAKIETALAAREAAK